MKPVILSPVEKLPKKIAGRKTMPTIRYEVRLNDLGKSKLGKLSPKSDVGWVIDISRVDPSVLIIVIPNYSSRERGLIKIRRQLVELNLQS